MYEKKSSQCYCNKNRGDVIKDTCYTWYLIRVLDLCMQASDKTRHWSDQEGSYPSCSHITVPSMKHPITFFMSIRVHVHHTDEICFPQTRTSVPATRARMERPVTMLWTNTHVLVHLVGRAHFVMLVCIYSPGVSLLLGCSPNTYTAILFCMLFRMCIIDMYYKSFVSRI